MPRFARSPTRSGRPHRGETVRRLSANLGNFAVSAEWLARAARLVGEHGLEPLRGYDAHYLPGSHLESHAQHNPGSSVGMEPR